jgi:murein DD-endopeptidase MepM/ murein hydrolase activator NlpD/beta-lactamase regulating signal transducer with metallopeptidase domain
MNSSAIAWLDQAGNAVLPFLLRQTLLSSILFVIVLILVRIFQKSAPLFHLGLYALVLVRLVLPPDFSLPFSGRGILDASGLSGLFSIGASAVSASQTETVDSDYSLGEETGETGPFSGDTRSFPWAAAVFTIWMAGVLVLSVVMCRRLIAFRRITRQSVAPAGDSIAEAVERWKRMYGIRRPVRIVTSDLCLSPFTLGVRRPVIHIPGAALERNDPELIESIIGHELAHVKTLDAFWIRIQNVLQVVYFFHPVVWVAVSRMHLLRECLCDDMVIARRRLSPESYGLGLLAVLKWNVFGAESLGLLPEFGSSRRKIMERINRIKSPKRTGKTAGAGIVLGTVLLGLFLLPMAGGGRQASQADTTLTPFDFEKAGKWIEFTMQVVQSDPKNEAGFWMNGTLPGGSAVKSVGDGNVVKVGKTESGGLCVVVRCDGYDIRYGNLEKTDVREGDAVGKGDSVGRIDRTGHVKLEIATLKEVTEAKKPVKATEGADFANPLPGKPVTAGFGPMRDPFTGTEMDHSGVDIKASKGSAVHAVADGKAVKAVTEYKADQGRGRFVMLVHADETSSLYSHLDSVLVSEGQKVRQGDVIGTVGSTGRSTGPHLHLEIRKGEVAIDPATVIDFGKGELREVKEMTK